MKAINKIEEYSPRNIEGISFDLIIASSGYESRAIFLHKEFSLKSECKIVFAFDNYYDLEQRVANDSYFRQAGYETYQASGNDDNSVYNYLKSFIFKNNNVNILVDYSSMTRVWYSCILKFFADFNSADVFNVNLFFSYTKAEYIPPPKDIVPNKYVVPIDNHFKISTLQKPTALIIGLGNENIRAFGLKEMFDAETFVFYTDGTLKNRYSLDVETCNSELLEIIPDDNVFKYQLQNMSYLHIVLNFLCKKLEERFKIVIAPCGPKPFTLIALFNSQLLNETSVWRISAGEKALPVNRDANGDILITKIQYVN